MNNALKNKTQVSGILDEIAATLTPEERQADMAELANAQWSLKCPTCGSQLGKRIPSSQTIGSPRFFERRCQTCREKWAVRVETIGGSYEKRRLVWKADSRFIDTDLGKYPDGSVMPWQEQEKQLYNLPFYRKQFYKEMEQG
mgnify:CR=1 FL=1